MISIKERIDLCVRLGEHILAESESWAEIYRRSKMENPWFTIDSCRQAMHQIAKTFLHKDNLLAWSQNYIQGSDDSVKKNVGLVLAGNIPAVGFHDLLCVFISGNISQIKYSSKDGVLLRECVRLIKEWDKRTFDYFEDVDRLKKYDAVIATGGNNSSRYFEYYFNDVPHIIRKSRNAVAVLDGSESEKQLSNLGKDVFSYFGLGCRNVSSIWVPTDYNFEYLLEILHEFNEVILHHKYKNNFDYNYALFLLNKEKFLNNGCILLKEDKNIPSRIASLHYRTYSDLNEVNVWIDQEGDKIQCLVGRPELVLRASNIFEFGRAQQPGLNDYADGEDVMKFLKSIQ